MSEGRLRLTILGGFLGSGKTTWLRHQLHEKAFGRVHVIVNEAADAPVDDALLQSADAMTLLAGACVCCDGQASLKSILRDLCNARSGDADPNTRLESIVLETSGLADPAAILSLIQSDPILVRQIVVAEVIVIVDALNAIDQLVGEALSRKQVEAADRLILTKTDIATPKAASMLCATLKLISPGAQQSAASYGSETVLPVDAVDAYVLPELTDAISPIQAISLDLGLAPDWAAFTVWLSALLYARGDQIVRVKGVIQTPAGRLLLQAVRKSVQSPEILPTLDTPPDTDNSIAVIGRGVTLEQLRSSLDRFT